MASSSTSMDDVVFDFSNLSLGPQQVPFNAALDAKSLNCTKSDFEEAAVDILGTRTAAQVQLVATEFLKVSGNDLKTHIEKQTSGNLEKLLLSRLLPHEYHDAEQLYKAMKGLGTNEDVLIEILTSRTNAQIHTIKTTFLHKYNKTLEKWVESEVGGDFRRALLALCKGERDESPANDQVAHADAQTLYKAGEGKLGTDEKKFIEILTKRSPAQNALTNRAYESKYGRLLEEAIEKETSGDFKRTLLSLVNPERFAASLVHKSIKGMGTDDAALIRLVVRHSKGAMIEMKKWYKKDAKKPLIMDIEGDTSGCYRKTLMRLVCSSGADFDALFLREAMRGLGTNDAQLIEILTHRTPEQRTFLIKAYKDDYGTSLKKSVAGDTSGNYGNFLMALATEPPLFDAKCLHKAMAGLGTKESVLIEILATRTNTQIGQIKAAYEKEFKKSLEKDIRGDTSGNFERLLIELLKCTRNTDTHISQQDAEAVAGNLFKAGEKRLGTDDDLFVKIMTKYSAVQLQTISFAYERLSAHRLEVGVEKETSGDYKRALLALIDPNKYVAELLKKTTKGLGTDDAGLIRLLVGRTKQELAPVFERYEELFDKSALEDIKGDTSGKYQRALVAYIMG
eukprot:TRINITY_DN1045_c0_g1_i2.p2 TRINITY_DN1045_c0_g1~~TRINITY_DN1045_c0_g1_i2.p2  ORF type:complete len:630 (+),score=168.20 TRINITY_DN1045_c0_g1_i2:24-1892(+)